MEQKHAALECIEQAISMAPHVSILYLIKGRLLSLTKQHLEAITSLTRAIKLEVAKRSA